MSPTPYPDMGLGAIVNDPEQNGKFKVMTLRNIALTAPYSHNGYFKTLGEIVHFYNTRDVPGLWPAPDVAENVNMTELGNLGLSAVEEDDIVAFLKTLSDGYLCR
jgi:cytochrome c peroxidase